MAQYGKLFNKYVNQFPNAARPSTNRCSKLPYAELKGMAKNIYSLHNFDANRYLYRYMNKNHKDLANAVYNALGKI